MLLSSVVIRSLRRTSSSRTRSITRPNRVEVESTSEPVAEIKRVGVTIAVKNSIVIESAFGFIAIGSAILKFDFNKQTQRREDAKGKMYEIEFMFLLN